MSEYLKSFVIGSSWFVFIMFFMAVYNYNEKKIINYNYDDYTIKAPLFLGCASVFAKFLHLNYNLSLKKSLFITSLITFTIVSTGITIFKSYKYKSFKQWCEQYLTVFVGHLLTFNYIVYKLEMLLP